MPERSGTLRLATYNIRKATGTDRRRDPGRILQVIRDLNADVVLLQEADRRLPPRPSALPMDALAEKTGLSPVRFDPVGPSLGAHGNALLVRPDHAVERVFVIDLPGLEPRGGVGALLRDPSGGPLCVIGVHLALLRIARRRQYHALAKWIDGLDVGEAPIVVAGDFNARSSREALDALGERLRLLPLRNSFHARWPVWPLDRIAVSADFELAEPRIVSNSRTRRASDHLPLVTDLVWRR